MPTDPPKKLSQLFEEIDELLAQPVDDASEPWIDEKLVRLADEIAATGILRPARRLPPDLAKLKKGIYRAQRAAMIEKKPVSFDFDGYNVLSCRVGGMGMVLQAWDPHLARAVAIKLWLEPGLQGDKDLLTEARALSRNNHPNIVTVYGAGVWNNRHYFTMEWIDGTDAKVWLEKTRTWQEIRDMFVEAGKGLAAAHEVKIQHRDFKASNILVGNDGRVYVADFGIAATMRSSDPPDESSTLAGTTGYIAPERLQHAEGDARSDQYSFCVALWEALHGLIPFCAPSVRELVRVIEAGVTTPVKANSKVPHWLSRVVRKGLNFDPDQRYPDMAALLDALTEEPPPGDRAEGGVDDESEVFETPGYMHAPTGARVDAELVDVVPQRALDAYAALEPASPGQQKGRVGLMVGAGLAGGALATLLAIGVFDFSTPTATESSTSTPLSERDRALLKFEEARAFMAQGETQDAYDAWIEGKDLLLEEDPYYVGEVAMELGKAIAKRDPKRLEVAWLAVRGAEAFELAKEWKRAAEAARKAAEVFRGAGYENDAAEYEDCAMDNDMGLPCTP